MPPAGRNSVWGGDHRVILKGAKEALFKRRDTMVDSSDDRVNRRNGYRVRDWDTRVETIPLTIPKLREGTYFPDWLLQPRRRAERAMTAVIGEAYLLGISTRKMERLVETMEISHLSKSQVSEMAKDLDQIVTEFRNCPLDAGGYPYVWRDALVMRYREGGHIVNVAVVVATDVNTEGRREILGMVVLHPSGMPGQADHGGGIVGNAHEDEPDDSLIHHIDGRDPRFRTSQQKLESVLVLTIPCHISTLIAFGA